jgi:EAL domain-containing protein (putative c-di-GMP-specific phosphodiesterase class I)
VKQKLVASITNLCREQQVQVIGEGVETVEEREVLVQLGCDLLQGFYIARPTLQFVDVPTICS